MKSRKLILALSLLLVAGLVFAASNRAKSKPHTAPPGQGMYSRMAELSEEEQKKLYEARTEYQKKMIPLRAEIRVLNMEIDQMIATGKSGKEVQGYVDKLNTLKNKQNSERIAHKVEIRNVLGEDKYLQMSRHQRFDGRRDTDRPRSMRQDNRGRNNQDDCPYYKKTTDSRYCRNRR
ncbi:MAG: periplasmic heavy metal sensor [FCB group bacterium]|nr:periplasmic heavy metal sensor [FCB group bacterium]